MHNESHYLYYTRLTRYMLADRSKVLCNCVIVVKFGFCDSVPFSTDLVSPAGLVSEWVVPVAV